jgi:membrane protease YdiL (CAAX protease family)
MSSANRSSEPSRSLSSSRASSGPPTSPASQVPGLGLSPFAAAFIAVAVAGSGAASYFAFSPERSGRLAFWMLAVAPTGVLAAVAAAWAQREDLLREWLSPHWGDFTRGILGAVGFFLAAWAAARVLAPVGSPREIWLVSLYGQIGDPRVLQAHGPAVAAAIAGAALFEEIVWRGAVTQLLAARVGSRTAWIWSAGLYTLALVPTAWALGSASGLDPMLVLCAAGGGLVWGGLARAFGSLVPGILAHALFDWAVVMMFPFWGPKL